MAANRLTTSGRDTMKHATIYSSAAILGRLVGFIMLPFYAHLLRGDGYAVIGMIDVALGLVGSLLGASYSGAIIIHYHEEKDLARKPRVVSTGIIIVTVATAALVLLPIVFSRPASALLLNDPNLGHLMVMALVGLIFDMAGHAASSWLLINRRSVTFASVNLMRLVVGLSLNILLIVKLKWGLDGYFISSLATSVLSSLVLLFLAIRDCGWSFDRTVADSMRKFMIPLIPSTLVSFVSRQIERVLVKFQVDLASVGILEMGYKFPILIAQVITTPFMQSWSTKRYEMAEQPEAPRKIGRMFTYYLFLACYAGLVMAVTIKPVLLILTPPEFHLSYRIAQIEIFTLILHGSESHFVFGLYYAKHTRVIMKIRTIAALTKIGLAYIFVSIWSVYGAAFSAAIMSSITIAVVYHLAQKRYRIEFEWLKVCVLAGSAVSIFSILRAWDFTQLPGLSLIAREFIPWIAQITRETYIGTWRDGWLPTNLQEHSKLVAEILINTSIAASYGLLLPWVRDRSLLGTGGFSRLISPGRHGSSKKAQ